jgi:hypothetical protein
LTRLLVLPLAAALLGAAACRSVAPPTPLPDGDPRPAALLAAWSRAAQSRQALRGRAHLAVDARDGELRLRGRQVLVAERPARLRVEMLGLLGQTVAVLVTDAGRYQFFSAEDRDYQTGPVDDALLWRLVRLPLRPDEAVDLLLGASPGAEPLALARAHETAESGLTLELADASGAVRRRLAFDAAGGLRALEVRDAAGDPLWTARYADFARLDAGPPFAREISLETAGGTRAELSLRDVELDPELPEALFRLEAP